LHINQPTTTAQFVLSTPHKRTIEKENKSTTRERKRRGEERTR